MDQFSAKLASLKPFLDDDRLILIMPPVSQEVILIPKYREAAPSADAVAKDLIDRARIAEAVIRRARSRR